VSQSLPTFSISSPTIAVTPWLDWTPAFNISNAQEFNIDQAGEFRYRFFTAADGTRDSAERKRNYRRTGGTFTTPIKIGGFTLETTFRGSDIDQNYPSTVIFVDPADTSRRISRVFARRFRTDFDWDSRFSLPSIAQGVLNFSP
jgi:hypothetical protein